MRISVADATCLLAIALLCTACDTGEPDPPPSTAATAEAAIGALVQRLAATTTARDFEAFGAEVTDDWTYFTSGGNAVGLEGFVELISGWTSLEIVVEDIDPRVGQDGRVAWSTFRGTLTGEADGDVVRRNLRFTAILHHTDAAWKIRHLHSTIASDGE